MTYQKENIKIAKLLCFVLRHKPEAIGVSLDAHGWTDVSELIRRTPKYNLTDERLRDIVTHDDKCRFALSEDGLRIRANQGHSVAITPDFARLTPPDVLYHGTATRFVDSIMQQGLTKQQRHHVHLSDNTDTACDVGKRYGTPVVLIVDAKAMSSDGHAFYQTDNGVWLADHVPSHYLSTLTR